MGDTIEARGAAAGRSVRLFLSDGTPHGLIVAEVGNWNGKILCGPRSRIVELLRRPEASRTGIYIQIGPDPERAGGGWPISGRPTTSRRACATICARTAKTSSIAWRSW